MTQSLRRTALALAAMLVAVLLVGAGCTETDTTSTTNTAVEAEEDVQAAVDDLLADDEDETEEEEEEAEVMEKMEKEEEVEEVEDTTTTTAPVVEETTEEVVEETVEEEAETTAASATQEFDVVMSQFKFTPSTITVNEGDTVVLNVSSEDVDHGISLPEFGVSQIVDAGDTKTVTFVADTAGTYSFFCNVFCGSGHSSMKGTLVVQ